jgi:hypothetical protein
MDITFRDKSALNSVILLALHAAMAFRVIHAVLVQYNPITYVILAMQVVMNVPEILIQIAVVV